MKQPALMSPDGPTEAEAADQLVRRHLAALVFAAQEGADADVTRLARAEMCRLVSAICAVLQGHRLHPSGACATCGSGTCGLRASLRQSLLPVRLT